MTASLNPADAPPPCGLNALTWPGAKMWGQRIERLLEGRAIVYAGLALGALCRSVWVWSQDACPVADSHVMMEAARSIAAGTGYAVNGQPMGFWPVGYPAFLAVLKLAFGDHDRVALWANVVISVAVLAVIHRLALAWFGSRLLALGVLLAMAVFPEQIFYTAQWGGEPLHLLLMLLALWLFTTWRDGWGVNVAAGLAFAAGSYVKPQTVLLPLVCMLVAIRRERDGRLRQIVRTGIVCAVMALAILPWTLRNWRVLGEVALVSTNADYLLYVGNNPQADGTHEGQHAVAPLSNLREARQAAIKFILTHPTRMPSLWLRKLSNLYVRRHGSPLDGLTFSYVPASLSVEEVERATPRVRERLDREFFRAVLVQSGDTDGDARFGLRSDLSAAEKSRFGTVLLHSNSFDYPTPRGYIKARKLLRLSRDAVVAGFLGYLVAFWAVPSLRRWRTTGQHLVMVTVGYFTLVHLALVAEQRYSFPIMPFLAMGGAVALTHAFGWAFGRLNPVSFRLLGRPSNSRAF